MNQKPLLAGTSVTAMGMRDDNWSDLGHILKTEPTGFADRLNIW